MSIRRCPGCRNLVERDSISCAVCGKSYLQALIGQVLRWLVTASALGSLTYFFFGHHLHV
jgi:hypothetical protein